jgi:threonine/homoserine/homoserine lactone efflux protein
VDITVVFYFFIASVILTLTPGPDILFVFAQSASQGKKAGIATALGLCTGLIGHTTAAAIGISAILYQSTVAFQIVKYAGAVYLLYLAYEALREGEADVSTALRKTFKPKRLYKKGIIMNLLNPKVSLFFLAFLPQFIEPGAGNIPLQMVFLGIVFIIQAFLIFSVVSALAGYAGEKLWSHPKVFKGINIAKAGIFTFLAVSLAFEKN